MTSRPLPKAIFFDVDGTLVSFKTHRVPQSAVRALRAAHARGVRLFTATGRHRLALEEAGWLQEIPFEGHVTLNGQYCYTAAGSENRVLHSHPLPAGDVRRMLAYLAEHPLPCMFMETDRLYINHVDDLVRQVHADIGSPPPPQEDPAGAAGRPVLQLCVYTRGAPPPIVQALPGCTYTTWHTSGLDILPKGGGKWAGIRQVLAHYGISGSEAAVFGDGENDLGMFEQAGTAVALGNAVPALKAMADYTTLPVEQDGIAHAFQELWGL